MRKILLAIFALLLPIAAHAQTGAIQSFCDLGGTPVKVQGIHSTNYSQGDIPSCKVEVFLTGTQIHPAAIYADANNTPLSNPFTANALGTNAPGKWLFFAPCGQGLDITMSGGIAPNTYPAPVTLTDEFPACAGGSGSPVLIETNGTPNIAQNVLNFVNTSTVTFTNPSGGIENATATPASSLTLQHNSVNVTDQTLYNALDDGTITPDAGYTLAKFLTNSGGGWATEYLMSAPSNNLQVLVNAPVSGQYVILYPTTVTIPQTGNCPDTTIANLTSARLCIVPPGIGSAFASVQWTGFGTALSNYGILPANVTTVYPFGVSGGDELSASAFSCTPSGGSLVPASGTSWSTQQITGTTGITGSGISSVVCTASMFSDPAGIHPELHMNVSNVGLIVYYTGTPIVLNNALQIAPPLFYNTALNTLGIDPAASFPGIYLKPTTVANLPVLPVNNGAYFVPNGATPSDCSTGGGTNPVWCVWNGTSYTGYAFSTSASAVTSINSNSGAFTFSFSSGAGSCSGTTCTFTGSGSGGGSVTNFIASSGSWPTWLVPSVATSTTTPTLSVSASAIPNSALANASITLGSTSVALGATISSATGFNAATATNLTSYPTLCSGGQFSQGLSSGSNNCATPTGLTAATVASAEVVSFSATPTFSTAFNVSRVVLTGNITSFTLGTGSDGQDKTLCFEQGSGPFTVAGPTNVHGLFTVGTTNATWNCQTFAYDNTDSIWLATGPGVLNE